MMEYYLNIQSDSGFLDDASSALRQWSMSYLRSLDQTTRSEGKKDRAVHRNLLPKMQAAGFVDIRHEVLQLPMSPWKTGKHTSYYRPVARC